MTVSLIGCTYYSNHTCVVVVFWGVGWGAEEGEGQTFSG